MILNFKNSRLCVTAFAFGRSGLMANQTRRLLMKGIAVGVISACAERPIHSIGRRQPRSKHG